MRLLIIGLFILNFGPSLKSQNLTFLPSEVVFNHPEAEVTGLAYPFIPFDYNSDGITDFVGNGPGEQFVYKGLGNEQFEAIDIFQGLTDEVLKVIDFDNDGGQDFITKKFIQLYVSEDSFQFVNPEIELLGTIVEVADFDNDGLNDLLIHKSITFEDDEIIIYYNQGDNVFERSVIYAEYDYSDIEIGDIDNDGDIDIIMLIEFSSVLMVALINEDNEFVERPLPHEFNIGRSTIKLRDLDGDDDLDIITLGTFDGIYLIENVDNYTSDDSYSSLFLNDIVYFDVGDFNGDGMEDIVSISRNNEDNLDLRVFKGMGGFNFSFPSLIESFQGSETIFFNNFNYSGNNLNVYDYDNDGKVDIIYKDGFIEETQIKWLKNTSELVSSTNDFANLTSISVFPNPSTDKIFLTSAEQALEWNDLDYNIFSLDGKLIKSGNIINGIIDIHEVNSGYYILNIKEIGFSQKILKQ